MSDGKNVAKSKMIEASFKNALNAVIKDFPNGNEFYNDILEQKNRILSEYYKTTDINVEIFMSWRIRDYLFLRMKEKYLTDIDSEIETLDNLKKIVDPFINKYLIMNDYKYSSNRREDMYMSVLENYDGKEHLPQLVLNAIITDIKNENKIEEKQVEEPIIEEKQIVIDKPIIEEKSVVVQKPIVEPEKKDNANRKNTQNKKIIYSTKKSIVVSNTMKEAKEKIEAIVEKEPIIISNLEDVIDVSKINNDDSKKSELVIQSNDKELENDNSNDSALTLRGQLLVQKMKAEKELREKQSKKSVDKQVIVKKEKPIKNDVSSKEKTVETKLSNIGLNEDGQKMVASYLIKKEQSKKETISAPVVEKKVIEKKINNVDQVSASLTLRGQIIAQKLKEKKEQEVNQEKDNSISEPKSVIKNLVVDNPELIKKSYGKTSKPYLYTKREQRVVEHVDSVAKTPAYSGIVRQPEKSSTLLTLNKLKKDNIDLVSYIFHLLDISDLIEDKSDFEFAMLKYGYLNDKYYSDDEIMKLMKISKDEIISKNNRCLLLLFEEINKLVILRKSQEESLTLRKEKS